MSVRQLGGVLMELKNFGHMIVRMKADYMLDVTGLKMMKFAGTIMV